MNVDGCEMTIWGAFGGYKVNNKRCNELCVKNSYFCPRHIRVGDEQREEYGKLSRERRTVVS